MKYPELAKTHRLLEFLNRELGEAQKQGESVLMVEFIDSGPAVGLYVGLANDNVAELLGMSGGEAVGLLRRLSADGYVRVDFGRHSSFGRARVESLTDKGLREIGELPDPQERFLLGLEAAIRAIREDESIPGPERSRRIDVLEEAKQIGRPLAVDIIKAMFRGEIPFM